MSLRTPYAIHAALFFDGLKYTLDVNGKPLAEARTLEALCDVLKSEALIIRHQTELQEIYASQMALPLGV